MIFKQGQHLCNSYYIIREDLQEIRALSNDPRESAALEILIDRFSKTSIHPWDLFDLKYSSGMSLDGLIVTYFIVLMQFKYA